MITFPFFCSSLAIPRSLSACTTSSKEVVRGEAEMNALFQQVGRMKDDTGVIPCAYRLHNLRQFGIIEAELSFGPSFRCGELCFGYGETIIFRQYSLLSGNMSFCCVCFSSLTRTRP